MQSSFMAEICCADRWQDDMASARPCCVCVIFAQIYAMLFSDWDKRQKRRGRKWYKYEIWLWTVHAWHMRKLLRLRLWWGPPVLTLHLALHENITQTAFRVLAYIHICSSIYPVQPRFSRLGTCHVNYWSIQGSSNIFLFSLASRA